MGRTEGKEVRNAAGVPYGELIRRQRKERHMNQEELGSLVRVGKNAVGAWEAGRSRPDVGSVPVICEALGLSLEEFFGLPSAGSGPETLEPALRDEVIRRFSALNEYNRQVILREMEALKGLQAHSEKPAAPSRIPRKVIRLFRNDLAASAGPGEPLTDAAGEAAFLFADPLTEQADEIIRVNGDSMEPDFADGEELLVKHASSVRPGEVGVFVCGGAGYVKEFQPDGLHSRNPAYSPLRFPPEEEVRCIGKVIGKVAGDSRADYESYQNWMEADGKGK